jgi:hypothetical protein
VREVIFWGTNFEQEEPKKEMEKWLRDAKAANLTPFITLGPCKQGRFGVKTCSTRHEPVPTSTSATADVRKYKSKFEELFTQVRAIYKEHPREFAPVTLWGAWNEPDLKGPPGQFSDPLSPPGGAPIAAYFWQAAQSVVSAERCKACKVLAGEFADYEKSKAWVDSYVNTLLNKHVYWRHGMPEVWGLHDYPDIVHAYEHRGDANARKFLAELPWKRLSDPHEWMTEAGVLLTGGKKATEETGCWKKFVSVKKRAQGPCLHQKVDAEDFLRFAEVPAPHGADPFNHAIYYGYRLEKPGGFDAALLEPEDSANSKEPDDWRPAYCVLAFRKHKCPASVGTKASVAGTLSNTANTVALDVNPEEAAARYWVEYGTAPGYERVTTQTATPSEEGEQSATVTLRGLKPCTTYHYQAEAENEANEGEPSEGGDRTFTTACAKPVAITAGYDHRCELLEGGRVECWGANEDGQLGDGTTTSSETPVEPLGITDAVSVSAGDDYTCAVVSSGGVYCWGLDILSVFGLEHWLTPHYMGIDNAVSVTAAGLAHNCVVTSAAAAECWGADEYGQAPPLVEGLEGEPTKIGGGVDFTCVLLQTGGVECWGAVGEPYSPAPRPVAGLLDATSVTADGSEFACARKADGTVACWSTESMIAEPIGEIHDATSVASGEGFACALLATGHVSCWEPLGTARASEVSGIDSAIALAAGAGEACVLLEDDEVECWSE